MSKYGKWIGGGLGWAFGGPIGAIIGFAIGSMLDSSTVTSSYTTNTTTGKDFEVSFLVLTAAVMKADNKILKSELEFVKTFFIKQFGVEETKLRMLMLREIMKKDIPVHEVSFQIKQHMDYNSRLLLIQYLFGIASADNEVAQVEIDLIEAVAGYMDISRNDCDSVKAMFVKDFANYYNILQVPRTATNDEIKKSFRRLAVEYHPDKVMYLGDEYQKAAKEKFQKLNEAYEAIKKERDIK
ncbi:MAG: DnaJ domain-containing protein [Bacteroidales bacterium]|nr:DnaJ domain-containing protein [Bacteroidales bacterium]